MSEDTHTLDNRQPDQSALDGSVGPVSLRRDFDVQHRDWSDSLAAARDAGGARLIVTSPPYPDARTVAQYGGAEFDTSLEGGYGRLGEACFAALMPGGVCALNIDGPIRVWRPELGESERSLIAFKVAIDWAERIGFRYVERCVYGRDGFPISEGPRWRSGGELVHVFSRPGAPPHFDRYGMTLPAKYKGASQRAPGQGSREAGQKRVQKTTGRPVAERRSLMTVERHSVGAMQGRSDHAAAFCESLADAFVLCYSEPGSLVCDPFVGSGTVAISCHRHGRRFVGGDLGHRERDGRRWADVVNDGLAQGRLFPMEAST
jgi:hypothetical protein